MGWRCRRAGRSKAEMVACLAEMRDPTTTSQRKLELMAQEARFELSYTKARSQAIAIHELTTSRKTAPSSRVAATQRRVVR